MTTMVPRDYAAQYKGQAGVRHDKKVSSESIADELSAFQDSGGVIKRLSSNVFGKDYVKASKRERKLK